MNSRLRLLAVLLAACSWTAAGQMSPQSVPLTWSACRLDGSVACGGGGGGTGLLTLNGLTADPQSFARVNDTNVTLTITSSGSTHTFTMGWANALAETRGGTGQSTFTLGDTLYASASNTLSKLAGNTATTRKFYRQTGNGTVSAAPAWDTLVAGDIPDLSATYQPLDSDLTALAGLSSNGIPVRTGTGTAAVRTITGTSNEVTVTNGDGVSGNPTVSLPSALDLSSKTVRLTKGLLSAIPGTCTIGDVYIAYDATSGQNWYLCTATNTWTLQGNQTSPFTDATAIIFNAADSTKLVKIDASGVTTGTTRTWTAPNASGTVVLDTATQTLTNKRVTARVGSTTSSATPTINTDSYDIYKLTAQAADITSFTTNLSGTPTDGQKLEIRITGTASRAITWGASFVSSTATLPSTTNSTDTLYVLVTWNADLSKWVCLAVA